MHPWGNESGVGLCLRALTGNRLSLNWMRRELRLNPCRLPDDQQMEALACLLGVDVEFVRRRTVRQERARATRWMCWVHQGLLGNQVRISRPQVCPRCIHETGYCLWDWDFALVTCCQVHRCVLIDRCGACGQPLRWDRPRPDLCRCKRPIVAPLASATEEAQAVSKLFGLALRGGADVGTASAIGLPDFICGLSVAGLTTLFQAFGDLTDEHRAAKTTTWIRSRTCEYWAEVTLRAARRLHAFQLGRDVEPLVNASLLRRLARNGVTAHDRRTGSALLRMLGGRLRVDQLELFEEGGST